MEQACFFLQRMLYFGIYISSLSFPARKASKRLFAMLTFQAELSKQLTAGWNPNGINSIPHQLFDVPRGINFRAKNERLVRQ